MKKLITIIVFFVLSIPLMAQTFSLSDTIFKEGDKLVSHRVVFDFDKATLRTQSFPFLDSMVVFLTKYSDLEIEIANHCDERWSEEYSQCLTCKRAHTITQYFISKGIDPDRLVPKGYNDLDPLIVNAKTEDEHLLNRRTEFIITALDYQK